MWTPQMSESLLYGARDALEVSGHGCLPAGLFDIDIKKEEAF